MLLPFISINPILIAAAVIPAIVLFILVYRLDKLEKESPRLLIALVIYGVFATGLASLTEEAGTLILGLIFTEGSLVYDILMYFVVVAFTEEGFKYLLLKRRSWNEIEFNCRFDGIVYAVSVSLGFALWENIGYVVRYGFKTAMVRAVTAVPGHVCFAVFMGVFYGLARHKYVTGQYRSSGVFRKLALIVPTLLHGTYDFLATRDAAIYSWFFVGFVAIMFTVSIIVLLVSSKHDKYLNSVTQDGVNYRVIDL